MPFIEDEDERNARAEYFAARHPVILFLMLLVFVASGYFGVYVAIRDGSYGWGKRHWRTGAQEMVYRTEDPVWFWGGVIAVSAGSTAILIYGVWNLSRRLRSPR